MRHLPFAATVLVAALLLAVACGDDDDGGSNGDSAANDPDEFLIPSVEGLLETQIDHVRDGLGEGDPAGLDDTALRDMLTGMVLQPEDVPEGIQSLGGGFSTNEDTAGGVGGGPSKEQLDEWGRILGYSADYQRTEPPTGANITAVNTAISVYSAADGAAESFDDRVSSAREVDWQVSYPDVEEFQTTELTPDIDVDGLYWIRISGYQQSTGNTRAFFTDDQILFRIGQAWGFLRAVSTGPEA